MHSSVMEFVRVIVNQEMVQGKRILEVGAYDVNGSVRPMIEALGPSEYIGTDMRAGPMVDMIVDATKLLDEYGPESFDAVVCCEMLEHCWDWRKAINQMKAVLKTEGWMILTTRSHGFQKHDYPADYWRYSVEDMKRIFADFEGLVEPDPQASGVFIFGYKMDKDLLNIDHLVVEGVV